MADQSGAAVGDQTSERSHRAPWWVTLAIAVIVALVGLTTLLSLQFVWGHDRVEFLLVRQVAALDRPTKGTDRPPVLGGIVAVNDGVWVVDTANARVSKLRLTGEPEVTWTISGDGRTNLERPVDIALDAHGLVYVLDAGSGYVSRFDDHGTPRGRLLGPGAGVYSPHGLAVDRAGHVYVADTGMCRLLRVEPSGKVQSFGRKGRDRDGLGEPVGVRVDESGCMYTADRGNGRIKKLDADGHTVAVWRLPSDPAYVALDGHGRIFATSPSQGCIWAVSTADGSVATVRAESADTISSGQLLGVDVRDGRLWVTDGGEVRGYEPRPK